ncbi:MAG: phosphopantothenoylcysteine decarboxylase [Phycisphaeraceae bacterium]
MKILITAGPTREPIDAVRFISNRSSGKMGLWLASAAIAEGHQVMLLLGPCPVQAEAAKLTGLTLRSFETATQLQQLLETHFADHDVLIMAAAVADYRPAQAAAGKLSSDKERGMMLALEATPDLVASMASRKRPGQRVVAFALEEAGQLEERAVAKLRRKGVDAIVANPLGTMEGDAIRPVLLWADGRREVPVGSPGGAMSKVEFARWLIQRVGG